MVVNFSVAYFGALSKLSGGFGRFLPLFSWFSYVQVKASWVGSVLIMGLLQDHWNPVIISAFKLFVGGFGRILKVQPWSF